MVQGTRTALNYIARYIHRVAITNNRILNASTARWVFGEEHSETLACLEHFVELYEARNKPEKAEEWRAKLPGTETVEQ